jgi:hypothetical protein
MTARPLAWTLGGLLVAGAALTAGADDNARRKGGGDGGSSRGSSSRGSSESAGARHTGGGSSRSGGEVRSDGGGQRERGSSASSGRVGSDDPPPRRGGSGSSATSRRETTGAEARHPEPGTGHGYRSRYNGYAGSSYYYFRPSYSSYYRPYYGWYGVPYYDWYWDDPFYSGGYYGGGGVYGSYYPRYRYRDSGSVRTLVEPEQTRVFVDGYYAGTVDDFDGMFQRLYVAPGRHDIAFKLEGFRTHRVMVYVTEDHTVKIRHNMERGSGDESVEDLSGGRSEPPYRTSDREPPYDERDRREPRPPYDDRREPRDARDARDGGALRLDVRPDDASIYVDGEFVGTARRAGILNLPPGRHRVEVVRPGHRTVERDVEIQPGRTETLAIDLERMD